MNSAVYPIIGNIHELPIYPVGIGLDCYQWHVKRDEGFLYPQFVIFTGGTGEMILEGKKYTLHENSAVFLPRYIPHEYYQTGEHWFSSWIFFDGDLADDILHRLGFDKPEVYQLESPERFFKLISRAISSVQNDKVYGYYHASSILYDFILEFHKHSHKVLESHDRAYQSLMAAIKLMDEKYSRKITMEELCHVSDLSEAHFCRLFKKHLAMRPMEYLNAKRIRESKRLLTDSFTSIESIAAQVGFESPSYFSKLFREYEGMPPSEYRLQNRR